MSCENCREAEEIDGEMPRCKFAGEIQNLSPSPLAGEGQGEGCIIPSLSEEGQRILEIRDRLLSLKDLVDSETILKLYEATKEDIEMLAIIENEIKTFNSPATKGDRGL